MRLKTKRVYEKPASGDGVRVLVDRLWPRGLSKGAACIDEWLKDVAPSDSLRRWFGHDPARWKEFQQRYFAELNDNPEPWHRILECARHEPVTLLYAARDLKHNHAVALHRYLEQHRREK